MACEMPFQTGRSPMPADAKLSGPHGHYVHSGMQLPDTTIKISIYHILMR